MGFVCDLHSTPLLARRGFPLAFRVGARWVSTPSSMPRLGAQFPLFVEFLRGLSAISASGKRCHVAQFSHWRPPLRPLLRTHRVLRVVVVSSSTCCCHLRLRPNSMLITQKPNIPEVFRPPSLFPVDPPQGGATAISHGAHPQTQPLSNSATVLLESQWACAHHDPTARCSAAGGLLVKSYLAQLQAAKW